MSCTGFFLVRGVVYGRACGHPDLALVRKLLQVDLEHVQIVNERHLLVAGPGKG